MDDGNCMHSMKYFAWRLEVGNPAERSEGDLPNDVRTHYITSETKERVMLAKYIYYKEIKHYRFLSQG